MLGDDPFRSLHGDLARLPVSCRAGQTRGAPPVKPPPTVNPITAPPPSRRKAKGAPPWAMATSRTMERPRPEPGRERASAAR